MNASESQMTRICVICKKRIHDDANVCPHCGHDYRTTMTGQAWEERKTPLPPIGGALIALSGVTQILAGLLWFDWYRRGSLDGGYHYDELYWAIGAVLILVGAFTVFVSPFAMTRRRLVLSLAGGVGALVGGVIGLAYTASIFPSSVGLVGILLIALARDEFVD